LKHKIVNIFFVTGILLSGLLFSCTEEEIINDESTTVALDNIRVSSFNVRFTNLDDGNNRWRKRRDDVVNFLRVEDLDIIGMQEVLNSQVLFLEANLGNYTRIGVGRDDGVRAGEYAPVFVKKARFEVLDSGNFWLSETPEIPSIGWDAVLNRICTYAHLSDLKTGQEVYIFNTHFDQSGSTARIRSASLILDSIQSKLDQNIRVVLTGDLNVEPRTAVYNTLTEVLEDSFNANARFGPVGTFNSFDVGGNHNRRIDYVLFKGFRSLRYETVSAVINGRYLSDHFPVISTLAYRPFNN
jgi:endonuclease/exonuclease/phosphatase family metal-dependent hydrolase